MSLEFGSQPSLFVSSKELIRIKERKAEAIRLKKKRMMNCESLPGISNQYPNPNIGVSPQYQSDHKKSFNDTQTQTKTVSSAFFTRNQSSDLPAIKQMDCSILVRDKIGKKAALLSSKQFDSAKKFATSEVILANQYQAVQRIPLNRWKNVKLHYILNSPQKVYSVRDLSQGLKEIEDLTDHKPKKVHHNNSMSLKEALSSIKPNQSTLVTETVVLSQQHNYASSVDIRNSQDSSSKIRSNVPGSKVSFADNSNRNSTRGLDPMYRSGATSLIGDGNSYTEKDIESARSSLRVLSNWQIKQKLANEILYIQKVVKEDVTARLPIKSNQSPKLHSKRIKRKRVSVIRMPQNAQELLNQRHQAFSSQQESDPSQTLQPAVQHAFPQYFPSTSEVFGSSKKEPQSTRPVRLQQSPGARESAVEIVLGNQAKAIEDKNAKQAECGSLMRSIAAEAARRIDSSYAYQKQQTNSQRELRYLLSQKAESLLGIEEQAPNFDSMRQIREIETHMREVPFCDYNFQLYKPNEVFRTKYTDAKGTAWAEHWQQSQLKLHKQQEEAVEQARGSKQSRAKRSLQRSFSVLSPSRENSLPRTLTNASALGRECRKSGERQFQMKFDRTLFGLTEIQPRVHTAQQSQEAKDVHQEYLDDKGRTPPEEIDFNNFNIVQPNEDQFTESSMSKGYLMAKLTFDTNFKKRYYEQNLNKDDVSKGTDMFSDNSQLEVLEELERSQESLKTQLYPRGLSKAVEKIFEKKQFRKMVKHAGINLKQTPDDREFKAQRHYVSQAVQDLTNPLPLLNAIDKGQLCLSRVPIKRGLVQGFCGALTKLQDPVTSLTLDRNLVEDSVQAKIIATLGSNPKLKSIKTIGNQFNRNSLQALTPILQFDSVAKLEELSISHCNADQRSVFELLRQLLPKRVAISEKELDDDTSYHHESSEEDEGLRQKERNMLRKEFKMPQSEIMLALTELPQQPLKSGNNEPAKEPDHLLVYKRKYFEKAVKNQLMTEDHLEDLKARQREILKELKTLVAQKRSRDATAEQSQKAVSKKSTKMSVTQANENQIQVLPSLKRLGLASVIENKRVFAMLLKVIEQNTNLQELDLSWNRLIPSMVQDLLVAISKHGANLQCLDLSWINIGGSSLTFQQQDQFAAFIARSRGLMHLNLTNTNLEGELLTKVLLNIKRSTTLVAVHLCQAQLGPEHREFIYKRMKAVDVPVLKNPMDFVIREYEARTKPKYEVLHEVMEFKEAVKGSKSLFESIDENHGTHDQDCLILSRVLGHPEIPNSSHWKVSDQCWVCQKWKYTLIFFDQTTHQKLAIQDPVAVDNFRQALFVENASFKQNYITASNQGSSTELQAFQPTLQGISHGPKEGTNELNQHQILKLQTNYICGTFNQWRPHKMHSVSQLVARLENCYFNGLDYIKYRTELFTRYKHRLLKCLKYPEQDVSIIDFPRQKDLIAPNENIYVYADFIKPGVHKYSIMAQDGALTKPKAFCVEPFRGHLKVAQKEYKLSDVTRQFVKEKSMFKDWQECNQKKLLAGFEYELQFWRIPKFVKDERIQKNIFDTLCSNRDLIKTVFLMLCSQSNYPSLSWLDFQNFLMGLGIVGVPGFQSADADRVYIAAKVPIKELIGQGLPEAFMSRHEFLEALVRVADQRFVLTKQLPTTDIALKSLLGVIKQNFDIDPWMKWRKKRLWVLEVNDLLENNKVNLQRVYKSYFKERKAFMTKQDAIDLAVWQTALQIPDKEALQCYGMCKMTCNNDILDRDRYDKLLFVEFLEYLGRLAEGKYPDLKMPLVDKLEKVIEIMFAKFGLTAKSKHVEVEYVSCSEEELDERKYYDWQTTQFGQVRVIPA